MGLTVMFINIHQLIVLDAGEMFCPVNARPVCGQVLCLMFCVLLCISSDRKNFHAKNIYYWHKRTFKKLLKELTYSCIDPVRCYVHQGKDQFEYQKELLVCKSSW